MHDGVNKDFVEEVIFDQGLKNMSRNLYQTNKDEGREKGVLNQNVMSKCMEV